jgi:transcription elongation factor SPT5
MKNLFLLGKMDPAKIEEYLTERYGSKSREIDDDDDQIPDEIIQQRLLPDVKSPNIWPVKCRIGEEKQTALLLMRKYLALENNEKVKAKLISK